MWEWMYRSTFLDLGTSWRWVVNFTLRPLYPRGGYPLDRKLGGPRAGLDDVEKRKCLTPPGLELRLLCRPAIPLRYYGSLNHVYLLICTCLTITVVYKQNIYLCLKNWPTCKGCESIFWKTKRLRLQLTTNLEPRSGIPGPCLST
jgi:hypothetical protein